MKDNKLKKAIFFAVILAAVLVSSCNGDKGDGDDTLFGVDTVVTTETEAPDTEDTTAESEPPAPVVPDVINPITGLEAEEDYSERRPVAIMINNIKQAIPQEGISYADVMYECVVEGGLTRLMMVVSDYESLPTVGSVRSSREYYLDFAADHNAIYIHAGGSDEAYRQIKSRKVNNIDGVTMYIPDMFYRDDWRLANLGYVHSLVTDGGRIVKGIAHKKYSTELAENFDSPLDFVPFGEERVPEGESGEYVSVTYSGEHTPYFEYNTEDKLYYRFQFKGEKHIDKGTGEQIAFTNVLVLYMPTVSTGDDYKHMSVDTTGSGEGYYFTMGKYEKIKWEKTGVDTPMKLYNEAGEELLINRGKTFFQICTTLMKNTTEIR